MSDLDAIAEDIEMAARSPEMARHVALDHGPELIAELKGLRAEVGLLRGRCNVRPMTEVESNLMTQVLALRRDVGRSARALSRVREVADRHVGAPCDCNAIAHQILAALDIQEPR